eukprot:CAMPEP_0119346170 /NCGR_PEP_ID=MMETSP1333-20130426/107868_1 /TAXON_ID=418940 /ORGANISM="Scyphosphaera apsteinii, Strain RCC1455" /LENGTH=787 /DNA_ID=CAMNT_0007358669 /DNA_START=1 /DNA_END=2364 /DNA_ORIENTATION=+
MVDSAFDRLERQADKILVKRVARMRTDPYESNLSALVLEKIWLHVWPEVREPLKAEYLEEMLSKKSDTGCEVAILRAEDTKPESWPPPPSGCASPMSWLRAKILYVMMPADRPVRRSKLDYLMYYGFMALELCPLTCQLVLVLQLALIDASDEFQLLHFICRAKVWWIAQRLLLLLIGMGQFHLAVYSVASGACGIGLPGSSDFELLLSLSLLPQYLLTVLAYVLYLHIRSVRQRTYTQRQASKTARQRGMLPHKFAVLPRRCCMRNAVPPDPKRSGRVEVHAIQAANLEAKDSKGDSSDPYAVLSLGKEKRKTIMRLNCLNPRWDEGFGFEGVLQDLAGNAAPPLHIQLYDYDMMSSDDKLGDMRVSLQPLLKQYEVVIPPTCLAHTSSGQLGLTLKWRPFAPDEATGNSKAAHVYESAECGENPQTALEQQLDGNGKPDPKSHGEIEVHIVSAKNLIASDRGGTSDPYVIARLGSKKQRTKTSSKTLEPWWDETLSFEGQLGNLIDKCADLRLNVRDQDVAWDDSLGSLEVDLNPLLEMGVISCINMALVGVKHGSITCYIRWWPHAEAGGRICCTPSNRQRAEPGDDRLFRACMRLEALLCLTLLLVASLDLARHKEAATSARGTRSWVNQVTTLPFHVATVWSELCTLTAASHLRQLVWFYSIYAVVCAAPLVVFSIPAVVKLLLKYEPTGYDQSGKLRNKLTGASRRAKFHEDYAAAYPPAQVAIAQSGKTSPSMTSKQQRRSGWDLSRISRVKSAVTFRAASALSKAELKGGGQRERVPLY